MLVKNFGFHVYKMCHLMTQLLVFKSPILHVIP